MPDKVLDLGPVNARGALRGHHARVVWTSGVLYVISKNGRGFRVQSMETAEPVEPSEPNGHWRAEGPEGRVSFTRRGCSSCSSTYRSLRAIPLDDIVAGTVS